jgi:GH25 family lysozyme M1 (1,4-beta-N-acetylmuramidase)
MSNRLKGYQQSAENVLQWLRANNRDAILESEDIGFDESQVFYWLVGRRNGFRRERASEAQGAENAPAQTPVAQPVSKYLNGIDIYEHNTGFPSFDELSKHDYSFVFHKASEGSGKDNKFDERWPEIKKAGLIRGAYHFFNRTDVPEQVKQFVSVVKRLLPGDLGPSLDLEFRRCETCKAKYWIPKIHEFADGVEAALGRQPIFYTSASYWKEFVGDSSEFSDYPLWVVWVGSESTIRMPQHWKDWAFRQWHFECSCSAMPPPFKCGQNCGGKPISCCPPDDEQKGWCKPPPCRNIKPQGCNQEHCGTDLDYFKGSIYELRGLADLGRTAPYSSNTSRHVIYTEPDGHLHQLTSFSGAGPWVDVELTSSRDIPLAAGDTAACSIGNFEFIIYRGKDDDHIYGLSLPHRNLIDLTNTTRSWKAASDPHLFAIRNYLYVSYWGDDNRHYFLWFNGAVWNAADLTNLSGSPEASGNPVGYAIGNIPHIVSRAGNDGHLHDIWFENGSWRELDLTQSTNAPAATYRPAVYKISPTASRIVFRAVRGQIHEIARDSLTSQNLSEEAGGAPTAAGSPDVFVLGNSPHIVYRAVDKNLYDIYWDGAYWRYQKINCSAAVAADPSAFVKENIGYVTFRGADGYIYEARYDGLQWACERISSIL